MALVEKLLKQLQTAGLTPDALPTDLGRWHALLSEISRAYTEDDRAVESKEDQLHNALNSLDCGFLLFDRNSRLLFSNERFREFYAGKVEAIQPGSSLDETLAAIDEVWSCSLDGVGVGRVVTVGERTLHVTHQRTTDGGWATIFIDVTQEEKARKMLQVQKFKLVEASKMATLGEMASGVAHEINNPLAVIQGRAEYLGMQSAKGPVSPEKVQDVAQKIEKMAVRIAKIVKGLRAFARDGDQDPMEMKAISAIVEDTLELCATRFKSNNIELRVQPVDPNIFVLCRGVQISQVLLNLLNNAFDAIETLEEKWIEVTCLEKDSAIYLTITDCGGGIPPAVLEKLMTPFFTTKEVGKGTGLGLSISKGIIESHKGTLTVDTKCPNTRFIICLPRPQAMEQAA